MVSKANETTFAVSLEIGERALGTLMAEATRVGAWNFNFAVTKVPKSRKTKEGQVAASRVVLNWIHEAGDKGFTHVDGLRKYEEAGYRRAGYYSTVTTLAKRKLIRIKDSVSYITKTGIAEYGE